MSPHAFQIRSRGPNFSSVILSQNKKSNLQTYSSNKDVSSYATSPKDGNKSVNFQLLDQSKQSNRQQVMSPKDCKS